MGLLYHGLVRFSRERCIMVGATDWSSLFVSVWFWVFGYIILHIFETGQVDISLGDWLIL